MARPQKNELKKRWNSKRNRWEVTVPPKWTGKRQVFFFGDESNAEIWMAQRALEKAKGLPLQTDIKGVEPTNSVRAVAKLYLKDREGDVSVDQLRLYENHLDKLVGEYGGLSMDDVDPLKCRTWIRGLKYAQRTKHGIFSSGRTFFRWAMRYSYAKTNPFDRMEPIPKGEAPKGILTPSQMIEALEESDGCLFDFLVLGGFCGLRPIEKIRSEWPAMDFEKREFFVSKKAIKRDHLRSRGMKQRYVKVTEPAMRLLPRGKTGKIIPLTERGFRNRLTKLGKKMGLKNPAGKIGWIHDCLRHSAASYLFAIWQDENKVAAWLGHTSASQVQESYKREVPETEAWAWWSIGVEPPAEGETKIIDLFGDGLTMVPYRGAV